MTTKIYQSPSVLLYHDDDKLALVSQPGAAAMGLKITKKSLCWGLFVTTSLLT